MQLEFAAIALLFAGAVSGATGLALPLIAGPVFILLYSPPEAIMLTGLCSLLGQIFSVALLRKEIRYQFPWRMIIPGLLGVPLGTQTLLRADSAFINFGFGILLMILSLSLLVRRPMIHVRAGERVCDAIVGLCGGISGGLFGVSAVVPACWFSLQALDRHSQRAIVQPYTIAIQTAFLLLLWNHGVQKDIAIEQLVWWAPAVLSGVVIGTFIFRRVSCNAYSRAILLVTFASGLALVLRP